MTVQTSSLRVRYGNSDGTASLTKDNSRGGAYFCHDVDPGFGPMAYSVSATALTFLGSCGGSARFVFAPDSHPHYSVVCSCGWQQPRGLWDELRPALLEHLTR